MDTILKKSLYQMKIIILGKFIAVLGSSIYNFGISFFILSTTGSATSFAINLICSFVPRILIAPLGGQVADFGNRKRIIVTVQIMQATLISLLMIYIYFYNLTLMPIYIVTFGLSLLGGISSPSITASLADLVHTDHLQRTMGYNSSVMSISSLIGPVIGGMMYGFMSMEFFLLTFVIAYLISAMFDLSLDFKLFAISREISAEKQGIFKGFQEGLKFLLSSPIFRSIFFLAAFLNFFYASFNLGVNKVFIVHLQAPSQMVGFLDSGVSIGVIIGGIILGKRKKLQKPFNSIFYSLLIVGICLMMFSLPLLFDMNVWLSLITYMFILMVIGICNQFTNTPFFVLLQEHVDPELKGRVFSVMETMATILMPLSYITFGFIFDLGYYISAFIICGIVIILLTVIIINSSVRKVGNSL